MRAMADAKAFSEALNHMCKLIRLTVGLIEAIEVINLPPKKVHPFWMLLATLLLPIQADPCS